VAAHLSVHDAPDITEVTSGTCCGLGCGLRSSGYLRRGRVAGLDCDQPLRAVRGCGAVEVWACSNHRESKCVPCSWRYRRRLTRIAEAGSRRTGYLYMLTLTAPGDREHSMPSGDVCPCTPAGGVDLADWNASAASRWNRMRTRLRVQVPELEYLRAVEVQKRGALHLHVIVWSPVPLDRIALRRMAIGYGFGHELDLAPVVPGSRKHAYYVAKYVTKACDSRDDVPWRADVLDEESGEVRRMHTVASYRTWSASHGWGLTMSEVRAICARAAVNGRAALRSPADRGLHPVGADRPAAGARAPAPGAPSPD
jgi:hypothetical protein